jgi:hypothetical protein
VRLLEQSVVVPGPVTERLGAAARDAGVHLVMGVDEREEHGHQTAVGRVGGLICWENYMPRRPSRSPPRRTLILTV